MSGRHINRGFGFVKDMEKHNAATLAGWRMLRFLQIDLNNGRALEQAAKALNNIKK